MSSRLIDQLNEAIEIGELITIIYDAGHAPGTKRRILPVRIAGPLVYAKSGIDLAIKTYRLDRITPCKDDHPAAWLDDAATPRQRAQRINPKDYFSSWAYDILPRDPKNPSIRREHLLSALGVTQREYIDKEKTTAARKHAKSEGRNASHVAVTTMEWAVSNPPALDFHEGDIFYPVNFPVTSLLPIQVIVVREFLEVHCVHVSTVGQLAGWRTTRDSPRDAFHILDTELATWLCTGTPPDHGRIGPGASYSETLRLSIEN
jgi:hypothetical protein